MTSVRKIFLNANGKVVSDECFLNEKCLMNEKYGTWQLLNLLREFLSSQQVAFYLCIKTFLSDEGGLYELILNGQVANVSNPLLELDRTTP